MDRGQDSHGDWDLGRNFPVRGRGRGRGRGGWPGCKRQKVQVARECLEGAWNRASEAGRKGRCRSPGPAWTSRPPNDPVREVLPRRLPGLGPTVSDARSSDPSGLGLGGGTAPAGRGGVTPAPRPVSLRCVGGRRRGPSHSEDPVPSPARTGVRVTPRAIKGSREGSVAASRGERSE